MRELEYDGIIGGGPNGLTTAGYLSKAGLKVAVLERRYEIGGGLATENLTLPGLLIEAKMVSGTRELCPKSLLRIWSGRLAAPGSSV